MEIFINELKVVASNFQQQSVRKEGKERKLISFDFNVTNEDYHQVTTELYKNDFLVRIPEKHLEFNAFIHNYSTSITNLYMEGAVADFKLELIEK